MTENVQEACRLRGNIDEASRAANRINDHWVWKSLVPNTIVEITRA